MFKYINMFLVASLLCIASVSAMDDYNPQLKPNQAINNSKYIPREIKGYWFTRCALEKLEKFELEPNQICEILEGQDINITLPKDKEIYRITKDNISIIKACDTNTIITVERKSKKTDKVNNAQKQPEKPNKKKLNKNNNVQQKLEKDGKNKSVKLKKKNIKRKGNEVVALKKQPVALNCNGLDQIDYTHKGYNFKYSLEKKEKYENRKK